MSSPDRLLVHTLSSQRERLSRERREERFERLYRRLDERHERVQSIYIIEEKLRRQPFHLSYHDAMSDIGGELLRVDRSALDQIVTAVDHFLMAREGGKDYHSRLEESIFDDFEGFSPMTDPRLMGDLLFQDTAGQEPKGKVLFEYREGCFQAHFAQDEDYRFFEHKFYGTPLEESDDSQTCGRFISHFVVSHGDESFVFPLILINDHMEKKEEENTRRHEEQHFASRVSFLLNELNQACLVPTQDAFSSTEGKIKDEILAFTREGKMGQPFLRDYLPTYLVAFSLKDPKESDTPRAPRTFSLRERSLIQKEIRFINQSIAGSRLFKLGARGRAFLVSHLYDIPLRQFPDWIDLLDGYYRERENTVRDYSHELNVASLSADEQTRAEHLKTEFRRRQTAYVNAVLGVTVDGRRYEWQKRFNDYIRTGRPL